MSNFYSVILLNIINFYGSILESKWVAPSVFVSIEEQEAKKKREEEEEQKEAEKNARVVCNTVLGVIFLGC